MTTEQPNPHKTISLWSALTAIAIVGSTLAGAGWIAGRAYLQDEISQYKESVSWKAPDAIREISKLSTKLTQQLESINDYDALRKFKKDSIATMNLLLEKQLDAENKFKKDIGNLQKAHNEATATLISEKKQLQDRIKSSESRISTLNETIESLRGEIITVDVGQAESVGHKSIRVGVSSTSSYGSWASVNSGDFSNSSMKVGDNFSRTIEGSNYTISLVKINDGSCGFSYDIFKNSNP